MSSVADFHVATFYSEGPPHDKGLAPVSLMSCCVRRSKAGVDDSMVTLMAREKACAS